MENKHVCKNSAHLLRNGNARALMRDACASGREINEGDAEEGLGGVHESK